MSAARLVALIATGALVAAAATGFDFSAYEAASISDAYGKAIADPDVDYTIEAGNFKYKVLATYTGNHREIAADVRDLIEKWAKGLGKSPETAALFEHEVEVSAGKMSYWLPIQNPLVEPFAAEVPAGAQVTLFIMYVGARNANKVFIVNEFKARAQ